MKKYFDLKLEQVKALQSRIELRTLAERRVEYLISKDMVEEVLGLLAVFEKEGIF